MDSMEFSNEETVTRLLSNREILNKDYVEELFNDDKVYVTNPNYDLTHYLKTKKSEPNRFDEKYLFVK